MKTEKPPRPLGFTLMELLVVLATLALLATVLVPAMARTQPQSYTAQCLNNMRQLMQATTMYTHDYFELFPPNPDSTYTTGPDCNWVSSFQSGWMPSVSSGGSPDAGRQDLLANPRTSALAGFLGGKVSVFKCPTDPRLCIYSGPDTNLTGKVVPVVRSTSMNAGVGTKGVCLASGNGNAPVDGPWLDGNHNHIANQPYATFGKMTDFKICSPADIWVFVDDDPWTINDTTMSVIAAEPQFVDYPSPVHGNGTSFSFADGHAEVHPWESRLFIHTGVPPRTSAQPGAQYDDWFWWAFHATRNTVTLTVP